MVHLEKDFCEGKVPFAMTQKEVTHRLQRSSFCQMLSPLFGPVLHPLFKRNMGCTMFPFFLTVSPRDAVIPSLLCALHAPPASNNAHTKLGTELRRCMFVAGSLGAGIKQICMAPRPFYVRPDLLQKGYESWGYSSPCTFTTTHP